MQCGTELVGSRRSSVCTAARRDVLEQRHRRPELLVIVIDLGGRAEDHDGSVVHGMVERGSSEDERVEQCHRDTDRDPVGKGAQHAVAGSAMEIEVVSDPDEHHGDHEGRVLDSEADMTDKALVENRIDDVSVEGSALLLPPEDGAVCPDECVGDRAGFAGIWHPSIMPDGPSALSVDRQGSGTLRSSGPAHAGGVRGRDPDRPWGSRDRRRVQAGLDATRITPSRRRERLGLKAWGGAPRRQAQGGHGPHLAVDRPEVAPPRPARSSWLCSSSSTS